MKIFNLFLFAFFTVLLVFCQVITTTAQTQTADYYNVKAGEGKGIRFWSSHHYTLSMGSSPNYKFGPVNRYSLHSSMHPASGMGWTWGLYNQQPVTALSNTGHFQTKGDIISLGKIGIGTTTPKSLLHVGQQLILSSPNTNGGWGGISKNLYWNGGLKRVAADEVADISFTNTGDIKFRTAPKGAAGSTVTNIKEVMTITNAGKVDVCGNFRAKEVVVEEGWCDYVFDAEYQRRTLQEEQQFIVEKGYLEGFQSEAEMNGEIDLGDVTKRQQRKLEEAYLHLIDLNKEVETLRQEKMQWLEKYDELAQIVKNMEAQMQK